MKSSPLSACVHMPATLTVTMTTDQPPTLSDKPSSPLQCGLAALEMMVASMTAPRVPCTFEPRFLLASSNSQQRVQSRDILEIKPYLSSLFELCFRQAMLFAAGNGVAADQCAIGHDMTSPTNNTRGPGPFWRLRRRVLPAANAYIVCSSCANYLKAGIAVQPGRSPIQDSRALGLPFKRMSLNTSLALTVSSVSS